MAVLGSAVGGRASARTDGAGQTAATAARGREGPRDGCSYGATKHQASHLACSGCVRAACALGDGDPGQPGRARLGPPLLTHRSCAMRKLHPCLQEPPARGPRSREDTRPRSQRLAGRAAGPLVRQRARRRSIQHQCIQTQALGRLTVVVKRRGGLGDASAGAGIGGRWARLKPGSTGPCMLSILSWSGGQRCRAPESVSYCDGEPVLAGVRQPSKSHRRGPINAAALLRFSGAGGRRRELTTRNGDAVVC